MSEFDVLIQNAMIVDGSGKPAYKGSIGVKGDRVVAVGPVTGDAKDVVDASGLTAVPGFIDSHSHGDLSLPYYPLCENYVLMGCTTFVGGNCGVSPAPIADMTSVPERLHKYLLELSAYKYYPPWSTSTIQFWPRDQVNELMKKEYGWTIDWHTMGDYFKFLEKKGISANYAPLLGHATVRKLVMGEDYKRPSTKTEQAEMVGLIRQGLDEGCIGMSVGLDYDPDIFADREELVEHVSILKEYNAIFVPHSRRTGRRLDIAMGHRMPDPVDGLREVIDICRAAGVRMNIAHIYTGWYITPAGGPPILEEANRRATLMVIDEALKEGLDISFDSLVLSPIVPNTASYLCAPFEPWLREYGTREKFAEWLKSKDIREEIKDAIYKGKWYMRNNPNTNPRWAEGITVLKHKNPAYENKSLAKIATELGRDPFETWFDLIVEDPDAKSGGSGRGGDPEAPYHAIFFQHPASAVGLDMGVLDYKQESKVPPWSLPMIHMYSAYVGFYDMFVNRTKALTLEQAVHKTSTQVAIRHKLKGRGVIKEGAFADIVLMDLPNLKVMSTPLEPRQQPKGIEYVFVNGTAVVKNAKHTGATPGRVLRRG